MGNDHFASVFEQALKAVEFTRYIEETLNPVRLAHETSRQTLDRLVSEQSVRDSKNANNKAGVVSSVIDDDNRGIIVFYKELYDNGLGKPLFTVYPELGGDWSSLSRDEIRIKVNACVSDARSKLRNRGFRVL